MPVLSMSIANGKKMFPLSFICIYQNYTCVLIRLIKGRIISLLALETVFKTKFGFDSL